MTFRDVIYLAGVVPRVATHRRISLDDGDVPNNVNLILLTRGQLLTITANGGGSLLHSLFFRNFIVKINDIMYLELYAGRNWFSEESFEGKLTYNVELWMRRMLLTYDANKSKSTWYSQIIISSMRISS